MSTQPSLGDDRLRDRTGDFWYRRAFATPPGFAHAEGEAAALIGAVDDLDFAYLNGERIGRTGQESPNLWVSSRLDHFRPASSATTARTSRRCG